MEEGGEDAPETVQNQVSLLDISNLEGYLLSICPNLGLTENDAEGELFKKALQTPDATVALTKFIADAKNPLLFVQKITKGI